MPKRVVVVLALAAIVLIALVFIPVKSKGKTDIYYCPDGTIVDDPNDCPTPPDDDDDDDDDNDDDTDGLVASFTCRTGGGFGAVFDASASGGTPPYTYFWAFGDGKSSVFAKEEFKSVTHIYEQPGWYKILLDVTDSRGLVETSDNRLYVDGKSTRECGDHPLKLGVYDTIITVAFKDGTTKVLTFETALEGLAVGVSYEGKAVKEFRFASSFGAGDIDVTITARAEFVLFNRDIGAIIKGKTGESVTDTVPRGKAHSLFGDSINETFFSLISAGTYDLRFVSHITVEFTIGTEKIKKDATVTNTIVVAVTSGGGGGGGCGIQCRPKPLSVLSDPAFRS